MLGSIGTECAGTFSSPRAPIRWGQRIQWAGCLQPAIYVSPYYTGWHTMDNVASYLFLSCLLCLFIYIILILFLGSFIIWKSFMLYVYLINNPFFDIISIFGLDNIVKIVIRYQQILISVLLSFRWISAFKDSDYNVVVTNSIHILFIQCRECYCAAMSTTYIPVHTSLLHSQKG